MLSYGKPSSQKDREIAFMLDDRANGRSPIFASLVIRPEELTRTEPSRVTVHQTLGDEKTNGWADSFGVGLPTISIAGTTGWRGSSNGGDGMELFGKLNEVVYVNWHAYRKEAVENGKDPSDVRLIFVDTLDSFSWEVAPMSFVLRRSKQRPLLMQYSIQLQTLSFDIDGGESDDFFGFGDFDIGLGSLGKIVDFFKSGAKWIKDTVDGVVNFVMGPINAANAVIGDVVDTVNGVLGAVQDAVGAVKDGISTVENGVIGIAKDVAEVGKNIFETFQAVRELPEFLKRDVGQIAAAYRTAFCILKNSVREQGGIYQNYTDLYGASNCSSTAGGRPASPLADYNVFETFKPAVLPVQVDANAQQSINQLRVTDPVLNPMPMSELIRHAGNMVDGVWVVSGGE